VPAVAGGGVERREPHRSPSLAGPSLRRPTILLFDTWQGIRAALDRMDGEKREPDPWESHFVAMAIISPDNGQEDVRAIEMAELPISDRMDAHEEMTELDRAIQKAELRAAFLTLRVPGGHPGWTDRPMRPLPSEASHSQTAGQACTTRRGSGSRGSRVPAAGSGVLQDEMTRRGQIVFATATRLHSSIDR
jgi:hypothetical protein